MMQPIRALVVDDEERIRYFLTETLHRVDYTVITASNGTEALDLLRENVFDVAVLDLNLGGRVDGLRVLEALRWRWPATAVVILTAHGSLESAMEAIRQEVDGYLLKPAKPLDVREAVQKALERRKKLRERTSVEDQSVLQCGGFVVDPSQHLAMRDGCPLDLAPQEFKLLQYLVRGTPRVVPPEELVKVVRDYEAENRAEACKIIKWYIHRLRQQTEPDPSHPSHILTVRGVGYKFQS